MLISPKVLPLLIACLLCGTGCSEKAVPVQKGQRPTVTGGPQTRLPELPHGPADRQLRGTSVTNVFRNGSEFWSVSASGAIVNGTSLELDSAAIPTAWVLYQWNGISPAEEILELRPELQTFGAAQAWLVRSNYSSGSWEITGPINGSLTSVDYTSTADYLSPAGNTYAGLVVTGSNHIDILRLNLVVEFAGGGTVLLEEPFEDENYALRGWYDSPGFALTTSEHAPGSSTRAVEFFFPQGATKPTTNGARVQFPATDSVYVSFWVKYSANWTGSDKPYHPHEFHFTTNANSQYVGPAYTHLTTYIEHNEGVPLLAIQDAENIDESQIGVDLSDVTEDRSVAGCNGSTDGYPDDCYLSGAVHNNGKQWRADGVYFSDTPGPYYKNDWHFIEAYFKLNTIMGKGVADGVVRYWYDGQLLIDHDDVLLRTAAHPDMQFNQFLVLPYIGDGSPVAQTMWLDNLTLATDRP